MAARRHKLTPVTVHKDGANVAASLCCFASYMDCILSWGMGLLCLFISICFYTGTYDTAFVKITLLQTGGIALTALWLCLLAVQKRWPFSRNTWPWLLPFVVYFGWNFLTYLFTPYKVEAFDEFFRYVLYFCLSLIVLDRFSMQSARILTKCLIAAAWICCLYGFVQVIDRWIPGVDIMPWRGFFGLRVFSTHANPNFFADFVVFSSFIVLAEYLRTHSKRLLVLMALAVVDLFFSESKGAWLGFAASGAFFIGLYVQNRERVKKYARTLTVAASILLIGVAILAGVYAAKRFQSVSFRAYTWAATFDMVQDYPVLGTGLGSFKTIYPAYRKPQIFYLEKMHNNETQHAENEYLEQWATVGTVGLAIFLWLIFFVLYTGWRGLKAKDGHMDDSAWLTLGYLAAFFGICVHNTFDISMRFVSTGLFFALFSALLVRLNMPSQITMGQEPAPGRTWLVWLMRIVLGLAIVVLGGYFIYHFAQISGNVGAQGAGGWLVKAIGWLVLLGLLCIGGWAYGYAVWKACWARVPFILLLSIWPLMGVYGLFLSDHYYGIAAEFSRRNMFDGALDYYQKAITLNPFVPSYRQYRAYVLRYTMDMQRSYSSVKGDARPLAGEVLANDYDRALRDLEQVRKQAPNNALLYQAYGEFYYTYAVHYTKLSQTAELAYQRQEYEQKAVENMELAKKNFRRALLTDPVNESTYVYLASIAMMERNPAQAQAWIDAYRRGPEGVTEPEFLETHRHSIRLAQIEQKLRLPPFNYVPATVDTEK